MKFIFWMNKQTQITLNLTCEITATYSTLLLINPYNRPDNGFILEKLKHVYFISVTVVQNKTYCYHLFYQKVYFIKLTTKTLFLNRMI